MTPADIAACYEHQLDREASRMAGFTSKDANDRAAYVARWTRLLEEGEVIARMITLDGELAGSIGMWGPPERRQITYWVWRWHWGNGVATRALEQLLKEAPQRPV